MSLAKNFDPKSVESKWYDYWMENAFFRSIPDERKPYTIVIPPPNVTGILHMGHMLNNTIQDVLIRRARMLGFNACWVPGTDHASIATEAKVVHKLKAQGIDKKSLTREAFLEHAWAWTHEHGGIILEQLKKLGCSCDWDRTCFTMDDALSESVIQVFVDLFEKGLIYKGYRMVNWDPEAQTTLSDEEVIYEERSGHLFHIRYKIEDSNDYVTIATTRPETLLGDTAIAVHPDDERYHALHQKRVIVPLANRSIPIITDPYVDPEFGTGCLKITPAHDPNDKVLGEKYQLDFIDIFNPDGSLNQHGLQFEGMDRFEARTEISKALESMGALIKKEAHLHKVGTSERTKAVIEPRVSEQWFLKMEDITKPALAAVMEQETVRLFPSKFKNTYNHWLENIRDWNISRQLWWGQQIPAYYYGSGSTDFVVAKTKAEALQKARKQTNNQALSETDLTQDPDTLDTWFSSWLWPMSVFDGIRNPNNPDFQYYYPTADLVTGPDILFFWVARMIIAGFTFADQKPFNNVYLTGLVRDKQGRKMSKQLGNSPDALQLIENFGADGVRVGLLLSTSAGNDLLFDESLCQQGKNFANKIWNALRLMDSWEQGDKLAQTTEMEALDWFENRVQIALTEIEDHFEKYRISDALMVTYKLVWDDFCSWLLEIVKPPFGEAIDRKVFGRLKANFENILKLLHPFMPFLTEEVWHALEKRNTTDALMISAWPKRSGTDAKMEADFEYAKKVVTAVRALRKEKNIPFKTALQLFHTDASFQLSFATCIQKLTHIDTIAFVDEKPQACVSFRVDTQEFLVPIQAEDLATERIKIQEELAYAKGFLRGVQAKLSNARFVDNAPEQVVAVERKKEADTLEKIKILEESLATLGG